MSWNDDNVSRLKELWDQGLPTAQIGKLLGFTKNAVVGKAHRIGLERRPSPIRRTAVKPDRKKARSPVMPKLNFSPTVWRPIGRYYYSGTFFDHIFDNIRVPNIFTYWRADLNAQHLNWFG